MKKNNEEFKDAKLKADNFVIKKPTQSSNTNSNTTNFKTNADPRAKRF